MTLELLDLPVDLIQVGPDRARALDTVWVEALAALIRSQGLLNPITVRRVGEAYQLVTGLHRLDAVRQIGAPTIAATVSSAPSDDEARLEEVMENLGRQELKALDRCRHLHELKKVWERLHPEAANGGNKNVLKGRIIENVDVLARSPNVASGSGGPEIFGFAKATAEKIGLSQTLIKRDVTIWKRLSEASRRTLVGMKMAEKMTELKALSEEKPARQAQILELILDPAHPDIQNVAEALYHLQNGVTPDLFERRFRAASKSLGGLDDVMFDHVLAAHETRVIASLKRRGRI